MAQIPNPFSKENRYRLVLWDIQGVPLFALDVPSTCRHRLNGVPLNPPMLSGWSVSSLRASDSG